VNGSTLSEAITAVVSWFKARGFKFCLVGGLAVSFRTIERATSDVDLVIAVSSDKEAEQCVRELRDLGFTPAELLLRKESGSISTVRMLSPEFPAIYLDLLFFACGIEKEIIQSATDIEILPGVTVPAATLPSLVAMKVLSSGNKRRKQDLLDLENLISDASQSDLVEARKLTTMIKARGFGADRDLSAVLEELIKEIKST
jgi:predicted nucleotidyltransferase